MKPLAATGKKFCAMSEVPIRDPMEAPKRHLTRALSRIAIIRSASLAVGFFSNIIITRVLVQRLGLDAYGAIALLSTLTAMLPFADLGLGAAVVNATADSFRSDK